MSTTYNPTNTISLAGHRAKKQAEAKKLVEDKLIAEMMRGTDALRRDLANKQNTGW